MLLLSILHGSKGEKQAKVPENVTYSSFEAVKDFKKQNFMLVLTKREGIFCTKFDFTVKG